MNTFKEIPANKQSIAKRRLVCSVGINDADYTTSQKSNNKQIVCTYYATWKSMIERCYSERLKKTRPTYKNCTACKEWLLFSNFKKWMELQDWKGKDLDKDIIKPGNKVYGPDNCCFVDHKINKLLNDYKAKRGKHPIGVSWNKRNKRFSSQCNVNGKLKCIGSFKTPQEASKVYNKFKSDLIIKIAHEQTDIRVKNGLLNHANLILKGNQL